MAKVQCGDQLNRLFKRNYLTSHAAVAAVAALIAVSHISVEADAQTVLKIGAVQSMTGPFNDTGKATMDGARLYMLQHGSVVAGRKIEIVVKDDASVPDAGKRLAQELIVNEKVALLLGGITPSALSVAPLTAEAKIPMIVMVSGSSITVERSPYVVRTGFTLGQSVSAIAGWALKNGAKKTVSLVNDWAPGLEAETTFKNVATSGGAQILDAVRVPLLNPDFSPYLQRVRDAAPDTFFAVVPNYQAVALVKQFIERGMDRSGIRFITTGDLTPDDELANMPEAMLGLVTAHHYSVAHDSALNKAFVAAFQKEYGHRPSFHVTMTRCISSTKRLRKLAATAMAMP